jgi:hypothetical protein
MTLDSAGYSYLSLATQQTLPTQAYAADALAAEKANITVPVPAAKTYLLSVMFTPLIAPRLEATGVHAPKFLIFHYPAAAPLTSPVECQKTYIAISGEFQTRSFALQPYECDRRLCTGKSAFLTSLPGDQCLPSIPVLHRSEGTDLN